MKLCIKCTKRKPLDEFALNQAARNGRMSWCKVCKRQYNKDRRKVANDKKVAMGIPITRDISVPWRGKVIQVRAYKVFDVDGIWHRQCSECKDLHPIDDYRMSGKHLCSQCPECNKVHVAQWREDNRDHINEVRRKNNTSLRQRIVELEAMLEGGV